MTCLYCGNKSGRTDELGNCVSCGSQINHPDRTQQEFEKFIENRAFLAAEYRKAMSDLDRGFFDFQTELLKRIAGNTKP